MPRRRRWTPVKGTASRVYDARERLALGALDLAGRLALGVPAALARRRALDVSTLARVLVLRLDRLGDLVMSLPALHELRAALPQAHITLAVGRWSAELARSAPVDEVTLWSAPWVGRPHEGAETWGSLVRKARALRRRRLDLALDLQGDVRASALMWLTGARHRVGYANTGGSYLLTRVVPLDETASWVQQNRRAVAAALQRELPVLPAADPLTPEERARGKALLAERGAVRRPLVGIHPLPRREARGRARPCADRRAAP